MKHILLIGKNSYLSLKFQQWLESKYSNQYIIDQISVRDDKWKEIDYSKYDSCICYIGIAHKRESDVGETPYFEVNRDLVIEIARKIKSSGGRHFIFLSTMAVFGVEQGKITKETPLLPKTYYGKSKMEAESLLSNLEDGKFKVAIIRPPMIYGKNCKGNYPKLAKLAKKSPIFPKPDNKRSMIYVDNLSEFTRLMVENNERGIYHPQNKEYVNTGFLVKLISIEHGSKIYLSKTLSNCIKYFPLSLITKVLGSLYYDSTLSNYKEEYEVVDFADSVRLSER